MLFAYYKRIISDNELTIHTRLRGRNYIHTFILIPIYLSKW